MPSRNYRLFVGNLPHETTRDEVEKKFQKYGTVESVEIKSKKDFSGEVSATFCFVNLNTDDNNLRRGLQQLNSFKWDGKQLKVEVAKESFLQRLQRERQGNQSASSPSSPSLYQRSQAHPQKTPEHSVKTICKTKEVTKKSPVVKQESSSSDSSDSEDEDDKCHPTSKLPMFKGVKAVLPEKPAETRAVKFESKNSMQSVKNNASKKSQFQSNDILKKFESFSNVWKDEDEIGSYSNNKSYQNGVTENQIDSKPSQESTEESKKSKAAEEKRLKSIEERRNVFEQQKKAIQSALSIKKGPRLNKKIVFNDDDVEVTEKPPRRSGAGLTKGVVNQSRENERKAFSLFNDSDNEAEDEFSHGFQVRKQFEGKKGKKLLDLQSRFNNDQRFKLDERFYESDEESGNKTSTKTILQPQPLYDDVEGVEGIAEEREQQLQILSSILGQSVPVSQPHNESKVKGMLRFDPSKPGHSRYELSKEAKKKVKKSKPRDGIIVEDEEDEDDEEEEIEKEAIKKKVRREEKPPEPVSQDRFYSISDNLTESLKLAKESDGSGFSLLQMFGSSNDSSDKRGRQETYPGVEEKKKLPVKRPFPQEDSSSEEEENETEGPTAAVDCKSLSGNGVISTGGVWQENFFFHPDDNRLKEGENFIVQFDRNADREKFGELRKELKLAAKYRRNKSRKSANSFKTKVGQFKKKPMWGNSSNKTSNKMRPRKGQRH